MHTTPWWLILVAAACGFMVLPHRTRAGQPDMVGRAIAQFVDFETRSPDAAGLRDTNEDYPLPEQAEKFAAALDAEGKWPDIDYPSRARSGWPPSWHWGRVKAMAVVVALDGTPEVVRERLLGAIHRAIAFWIAHDFQCTNWWYNEIGIPKLVGPTMLLLGGRATVAEMRYATEVSLARYPIARTGQNKIWLAGNALVRGLLRRDPREISAAADAIWSEVAVSTAEGVQPDFSFHQHGAQQQFGNYGLAYAVNMSRWARVLRDTPWQVPVEKREVLRRYLLEGQAWVSWRGAMDISACGRQFMPGSPRAKTETIARVMRQAAIFDPEQGTAYTSFVARQEPGAANDLVGMKHFWRSDYFVARRPEFMATLKLSSHRVIGAELVNRENLSGYHLGDGALYLYRTGDEYADIFPLWNWSRLPGVTCVQTPPPEYRESQVPRDFVGGMTGWGVGVAVLDLARDPLTARKAWFFIENTVWCLGTKIVGDAPAGYATTINQSRARGSVKLRAAAVSELAGAGRCELAAGSVVEHDGWVYRLHDAAGATVEVREATGHWSRVYSNPTTPAAPVNGRLFTLSIDHGARPEGAHYVYSASLATSRESGQLLVNSDRLQAVGDGAGTFALVFWEAGEWKMPGGEVFGVDAPCLALVRGNEARVVDPTQKLSGVNVSFGGRKHRLEFPRGGAAGTPVACRNDRE